MAPVSPYTPRICGETFTTLRKRSRIKIAFPSYGTGKQIPDLSKLQLTVGSSILFTRTIRCLTPAVLASMACSRVWPPFSNPVSNSPLRAEITCGTFQRLHSNVQDDQKQVLKISWDNFLFKLHIKLIVSVPEAGSNVMGPLCDS